MLLVFCCNRITKTAPCDACLFIFSPLEQYARHVAHKRATWHARCLSSQHSNTEQQNKVFLVNRTVSACLGKLISMETRTQVNPLRFSVDSCNLGVSIIFVVGILLRQKNKDRSMWFVSLYLQSYRTRCAPSWCACAPRSAQDACLYNSIFRISYSNFRISYGKHF